MKPRPRVLQAAAVLASLLGLPSVQAAAVTGQGTWETTLQARDLDGNGVTDAFYDTSLNITWARQVNPTNGQWAFASNYAAGLSLGGYTDWRLTKVTAASGSCASYPSSGADCGYNVLTANSELAHLFYVTLGNKAAYDASGTAQADAGLVNTGDFLDFWSGSYWTGSAADPYAIAGTLYDAKWRFVTGVNFSGFQSPLTVIAASYYIAVRDGDVVSQVPEPQTLALLLCGLGSLALTRRRRHRF